MERETLEKLLAAKPQEIRLKGALLFNGVTKGARAYNGDPTKANLRNWQAAEAALNEFIAEIEGVRSGGKGPALKNILAVCDHLTRLGWKIKKSAAYKAQHEGKIRPQADGSFLVADAERFAETFLRRLDGGQKAADRLESLQQEKLVAEVDKTKAQARHWAMRAETLSGAYVPRELFERELARRAAIFRNDLETFASAEAGGIVSLAAGDVGKIPDVIEHILGRVEAFLARYSEDRKFEVPLPPPDVEEEDIEEEDKEEEE
jgi:hypothetical protein